jgi:hypothetical protein
MTLMEQIQQQMKQLPPEKQIEVLDFVTFLQERAQAAHSAAAEEERGKRIKAALQTLAELGTFADIEDPVEGQRQIRKDRPLPGREE